LLSTIAHREIVKFLAGRRRPFDFLEDGIMRLRLVNCLAAAAAFSVPLFISSAGYTQEAPPPENEFFEGVLEFFERLGASPETTDSARESASRVRSLRQIVEPTESEEEYEQNFRCTVVGVVGLVPAECAPPV
jgi:hypothetical protein